jgi:uncharacterized protein YlxW (UPF0749 family)
MWNRTWFARLSVTAICLGLGLMLVMQLRTQNSVRQATRTDEWEFIIADLIDSNVRLREEVNTLQGQLEELRDAEGGGAILQSLVDEVNHLRIANGLVEVSGPGIVVELGDPISVLDLYDLINELRNAGSEVLALNGHRIVAWTAISSDGQRITVDGQPLHPPYYLEAIGDAPTLEAALLRPGGLISLLNQAHRDSSITVHRREKLTLSVYDQPVQFVYAQSVE